MAVVGVFVDVGVNVGMGDGVALAVFNTVGVGVIEEVGSGVNVEEGKLVKVLEGVAVAMAVLVEVGMEVADEVAVGVEEDTGVMVGVVEKTSVGVKVELAVKVGLGPEGVLEKVAVAGGGLFPVGEVGLELLLAQAQGSESRKVTPQIKNIFFIPVPLRGKKFLWGKYHCCSRKGLVDFGHRIVNFE